MGGFISEGGLADCSEPFTRARAWNRGLTGRGLTEKLFVQTAKFRGISMKAIGRKIVGPPSRRRFNTSTSIRAGCAGILIAQFLWRGLTATFDPDTYPRGLTGFAQPPLTSFTGFRSRIMASFMSCLTRRQADRTLLIFGICVFMFRWPPPIISLQRF